MFQLRFNHVFLFLLLVSAVSSLILPRPMSDALRGKIDNLLLPVSQPVHGLAAALSAHWTAAPPAPRDAQGRPRTAADLQEQIELQQVTIAQLTKQVEELREQVSARAGLGDMAKDCRSIQVWGNDAGTRQTLSINSSTLAGLATGMPAISPQGLVAGRIEFAGFGGARVRLITDAEFTLEAEFGRFQHGSAEEQSVDFVRIPVAPFTCTGNGHGRMIVTNLHMADVKNSGLKVGDWVTLADKGWLPILQGRKLGQVETIRPLVGQPLFAEIIVKPDVDLMKLKEVMVVVK